MDTANRSGTISTTSGYQWADRRIGVAETKATNTEIVGGLAMDIAEASRSGNSRLMYLLHLRRDSFFPSEVSHSGSCCLLNSR